MTPEFMRAAAVFLTIAGVLALVAASVWIENRNVKLEVAGLDSWLTRRWLGIPLSAGRDVAATLEAGDRVTLSWDSHAESFEPEEFQLDTLTAAQFDVSHVLWGSYVVYGDNNRGLLSGDFARNRVKLYRSGLKLEAGNRLQLVLEKRTSAPGACLPRAIVWGYAQSREAND